MLNRRTTMFNTNSSVLALSVILILLILMRHLMMKFKHTLPLPPGPKRLPIVGNAFDIPLSKQWLTFQRWAEEYGKCI